MENEKKRWLDDEGNVRIIYRTLWIVALLLLAANVLYEPHGHYGVENLFGFFPVFGFLGFVGLVMGGKVLRRFIRRDEDYYDR